MAAKLEPSGLMISYTRHHWNVFHEADSRFQCL